MSYHESVICSVRALCLGLRDLVESSDDLITASLGMADGCRIDYDGPTDTAVVTTPAGRTLVMGPDTLDYIGLVPA